MSRFLWLAPLLFVVGCRHLEQTNNIQVDIGRGATLSLPEPNQILTGVQLVQLFKISYKDKVYSNQVVLTARDNTISVIALLPFGGELFRVEYADHVISSKTLPGMGGDFDVKYALADMVLIYASETLAASWSNGIVRIHDTELGRDVYINSELMIKIKYDKSDRLNSKIEYTHIARAYTLTIEPLSVKKL